MGSPIVSGNAMLLKCPVRVRGGFTLIELLVVMTVIGILLSIVVPRYFDSVGRAEEAVLKENLMLMRDAIDKYRADSGRYPNSLDDLVSKKYLRKIPYDPVAKSSDAWMLVPPEDTGKGAVFDVKSGAAGTARDGTPYAGW